MNENEKQPNDQELDDLLRQVNIPAGLKSSLREIPRSTDLLAPPTTSISNSASQSRLAILLVLAATVLGVAAFFAWPLLPSNDDPMVDNRESKVGEDGSNRSAEENAPASLPKLQLVSLEKLSEQTLAQLEIERLESRLQELQTNYQAQLGQQEYASIVLTLADQSAVDLGGSLETANDSMVSIIEQFPNTRGAEIAQQFLDLQAN